MSISSPMISASSHRPPANRGRRGSGNTSIEREQHDEIGSRRRAAARSIEMNRIGSGIGESDELAESAGRRRKRGLALPGEAYVHGVYIVIQRLEIYPMSFERPRPIDHVGQDG